MITYRAFEFGDAALLNDVFRAAADDLARRTCAAPESPAIPGPFDRGELIWGHLAATAHQTCLAHDGDRVIGYARTIVRGDVHTLTELFVRPEAQGHGVGRELLKRAFPPSQGKRRLVVASTDPAAVALYLKGGLSTRGPVYTFRGAPTQTTISTDLAFECASAENANDRLAIGRVDAAVISYRRHVDHGFLLSDRRAFLARRATQVVGYGYVGRWAGPIAALDPADIPSLLAHAESLMIASGQRRALFSLPLSNSNGVGYLLARGYQMDPSFVRLMSDVDFGSFDGYVCTIPSLLL